MIDSIQGNGLIGKQIKDYQILSQIGKGAFGAVYRAQHIRLPKVAAIKFLHTHMAQQSAILERFQREAHSLATLNHPHIVQVYDFDVDPESGPYIVMEWLEGFTVQDLVKERGGLSLAELSSIFIQLLEGLDQAHNNGIVHRDLKPSNLFLSTAGQNLHVKIIDFGIASLQSESDRQLTMSGAAMGTANYMPPEQALGELSKIDARSDLYTCGLILGRCLTGRHVFDSDTVMKILFMQINEKAPTLHELRPEAYFDPALEAFFAKSVSKEREDRFQSAGEMLEAFQCVLDPGYRPRTAAHPHLSGGGSRGPQTQGSSSSVMASTHPSLEPGRRGTSPSLVSERGTMGSLESSLFMDPPFDAKEESTPSRHSFGPASEVDATSVRHILQTIVPPQPIRRPDFSFDQKDASIAPQQTLPTTEIGERVRKILTAFARVTSTFQLYDSRNQAVQNALKDLHAQMSQFLNAHGDLVLAIEPFNFLYGDQVVYHEQDRERSLSFKLYRDGARVLVFKQGLVWEDLAPFIKILGIRYHGVGSSEDDVVTLLWKAQLSYINLIAVEGFEQKQEQEEIRGSIELFFQHYLEHTRSNDYSSLDWNVESFAVQERFPFSTEPSARVSLKYMRIPEEASQHFLLEDRPETIPKLIARSLLYLEKELLDPYNPLPVHVVEGILLEYRDHFLSVGKPRTLLAFFKRLYQWREHPELCNIVYLADDLTLSLCEKVLLRRCFDMAVRQENIDVRVDEFDAFFRALFSDISPIAELVFAMMMEEPNATLRFFFRKLAVKMMPIEPFLKRIERAQDEELPDLLRCLPMYENQGMLDVFLHYSDHHVEVIRKVAMEELEKLSADERFGMGLGQRITRLLSDPKESLQMLAHQLIEQLSEESWAQMLHNRWARTLVRPLKENAQLAPHIFQKQALLAHKLDPAVTMAALLPIVDEGTRGRIRGADKESLSLTLQVLGDIGDERARQSVEALSQQTRDKELRQLSLRTLSMLSHGGGAPDMPARPGLQGRGTGTSSSRSIQMLKRPRSSSSHSIQSLKRSAPDSPAAKIRKERTTFDALPALSEEDRYIQNLQHEMLQEVYAKGFSTGEKLAENMRESGNRLIILLHMLLKSSRLYHAENQIFERPLAELESLLLELIEDLSKLSLLGVDGQLYINDTRVRLEGDRASIARELVEEFQHLGISGWTFLVAPSVEILRRWVQCVSALDPASLPSRPNEPEVRVNAIQQIMEDYQLSNHFTAIEPLTLRMSHQEKSTHGQTFTVLQKYSQALHKVDELWGSLASGRIPSSLPLRRLSNDLVDALYEDEMNLLELLPLGHHENPLLPHLLHVTIYSMLIGKELGFERAQLSELALCAFFHDVGYAALSGEDRGFELSSFSHTRAGFRLLLKQKGFHPSKLKRWLCVLEHHNPLKSQDTPPPSLYARIVRIADTYDTLMSPPLGGTALSPTHALDILVREQREHFDPYLVQAFVNKMGHFPPGGLLELSDGSCGISMGYSGSPEFFDRPEVLLIVTAEGNPTEGPILDLAYVPRDQISVRNVLDPALFPHLKQTTVNLLLQRIQFEEQG